MYQSNSFNQGFSNIPKGIRFLLVATVGLFILQILPFLDRQLFVWGTLRPSFVIYKAQIWRVVTYMFLHGGPWHLLFNMLALWMFGVELEEWWGTKKFIIFYLFCGIFSGIISLFLINWGDPYILGASGAILGVLTAYAYHFPNRKILLFFLFPVPVRIAVIIFGFISIVGARTGAGGISHLTHLGGIISALIYLKYYKSAISWMSHHEAIKAEKNMRNNAERKIKRDRYFEETIDPILKKISEQGMDSLTNEERKKLEKASKEGDIQL